MAGAFSARASAVWPLWTAQCGAMGELKSSVMFAKIGFAFSATAVNYHAQCVDIVAQR
jgi:hypothetical protein